MAKFVAHLLATAALWVQSQTSLKIQKWATFQQRSGQHTQSRQKNIEEPPLQPFKRKSSYRYIRICLFRPAFLSLVALWFDTDLIDKGFCYYFFILGENIKQFKIILAEQKLCFGGISFTAIMRLEAECVRIFLGEDEVSVSLSSSSTNHTDHVRHFFSNS